MTQGLADLHRKGFGIKEEHQCPNDFAAHRSMWISQLQTALKRHFTAYGVNAAQAWQALVSRDFDGLVAICDQLGDDKDGSAAKQLASTVYKGVKHLVRREPRREKHKAHKHGVKHLVRREKKHEPSHEKLKAHKRLVRREPRRAHSET